MFVQQTPVLLGNVRLRRAFPTQIRGCGPPIDPKAPSWSGLGLADVQLAAGGIDHLVFDRSSELAWISHSLLRQWSRLQGLDSGVRGCLLGADGLTCQENCCDSYRNDTAGSKDDE